MKFSIFQIEFLVFKGFSDDIQGPGLFSDTEYGAMPMFFVHLKSAVESGVSRWIRKNPICLKQLSVFQAIRPLS